MGKYVHKFDTIADYNAVKYDMIRPQVVLCEDAPDEICWKRAVYDQGIEWVDLGLPSGNLWATKNLGAETIDDQGSLYAWGELTPKNEFTEENYKWLKTNDEYEKYNSTDGKSVLDSVDDIANITYGGKWHIPTLEDVQELLQYTNSPDNLSNPKYHFVSRINGKELCFYTIAGLEFWVSKRRTNTLLYEAYHVNMSKSEFGNLYMEIDTLDRYYGKTIRPVLSPR